MKRLVPIVLVCALTILPVLSCGADPGTDAETQASSPDHGSVGEEAKEEEETEAVSYLDTLPSVDMEGKGFRMLVEDRYPEVQNVPGESIDGTVVNDALFNRNAGLEERFDMALTCQTFPMRDQIVTELERNYAAGDDIYHVVMASMTAANGVLARKGLLYDLTKLNGPALEEAWWLPSCNEDLYIGRSLYFAASPSVPTFFTIPYAISYNKKLAAEYNISDLYGTVADGRWTYDLLVSLASGVTQDSNGDGLMTDEDRYGFATHTSALWGYYATSGIKPLEINDDYSYQINIKSPLSVDCVDKLSRFISDRAQVYYYDGSTKNNAELFVNDQCLFADSSVMTMCISYRDMESEWGILPLPKFTDTQEEYYTSAQTQIASSVSVPGNVSSPDDVGLLLEAMTYVSDIDIRNAVYDVILTGKLARDENSVKMLDIIYRDINLDLIFVYGFADMHMQIMKTIAEGTPFVSAYEKSEKRLTKEIEKFISDVRQNTAEP